jgi:hypothetical protein
MGEGRGVASASLYIYVFWCHGEYTMEFYIGGTPAFPKAALAHIRLCPDPQIMLERAEQTEYQGNLRIKGNMS